MPSAIVIGGILGFVILVIIIIIFFATRKKVEDKKPPKRPMDSYDRDMKALETPPDINKFEVKMEKSEMEGVDDLEKELEAFDG